jgi:hypothetical protein
MCLAVPDIKSRCIKPKTSADRGADFLSGIHCPGAIAEPFFGRNPSDRQIASTQQREIATSIVDFLDRSLRYQWAVAFVNP